MNQDTTANTTAETPTPLTRRLIRAGKTRNIPREVRKMLGLPVGRRSDQWGSKAMRRGVQKAKELKQRPSRLAFIFESMRQANEVAKEERRGYLQRRTDRWRALVEAKLPVMLNAALRQQGLV